MPKCSNCVLYFVAVQMRLPREEICSLFITRVPSFGEADSQA